MTPRARIEAALNHNEPDRTPIFEYVLLSPLAEQILGRPFIDYAGDDPSGTNTRDRWYEQARELGWEKTIRGYALARLDLACVLGHDMLYICPNPLSEDIDGYDPLEVCYAGFAQETGGGPVERLMQRNSEIEECDPAPPEKSFYVYEVLKDEMARRGIDLPILAPAYAHGVWTDADLMQTMLLEPEVAHRHFALATERVLKLIDRYLALGIDQLGVGGDFSGKRPIISPESYRTFIVPEVRRLSRHVHEAGGWAVNASDGDLWPVVEDFLIGCEVDGYLEIDMFAGMDLKRLKQEYGRRITLYGNMDCGNVLSFEDPQSVREETVKTLQDGGGNGGHIFCANNAITASVPLRNYLAMVNAYRDMFGLPRLELPED